MSIDQIGSADSDSGSRNDELDEAIVEFLRAKEQGIQLDVPSFLKKHAGVADELEVFIGHQTQFGRITSPVRRISELTRADHELPFKEFGDYEIIRELGRGGMGIIFEAKQKGLKRNVALKMIREGRFSTNDDMIRFQAEAEAAAALDHPYIVPVYRVGNVEGRPFFTMKLVGGGSLKEKLESGPLEPIEAAKIAMKIASAVHYAHQRGILHRDLKPANILLEFRQSSKSDSSSSAKIVESGSVNQEPTSDSNTDVVTPLISDFGLAKQLDNEVDQGLTKTGAVLGTPSFMSPEQASGTGSLTTSTDIYGVGAILYNMLTGNPPFVGKSPAEITRKVIDLYPTLPSGASNVDLDLKTICFKCLEKSASDRFVSSGELADDLQRYIEGKPIRARRSSAFEQLIKWGKRNRTLAASLLAIAALLMLTLVGTMFFLVRLKGQEVETAEQRDRAIRQLFESKSAEVSARRSSGESGQRFGAIAAAKEAVAQLDLISATPDEIFALRSEAAGCLGNVDLLEIATWDSQGYSEHCVFSPDLKFTACHAAPGELLQVYRTEDATKLGSVEGANAVASIDLGNGKMSGPHRCRFSACGSYLSINCIHYDRSGDDKNVQTLFDVDSRKIVFQESGASHGCVGQRDGEKFVATATADSITIRRLPDLEQVISFKNPSSSTNNLLKFSPNGEWLAQYGAVGCVIFDAVTGEVAWTVERASPFSLDWHPAEPEIAISNRTEVQVWRLEEETPRQTASFPGHTEFVFQVRYTPDGLAVAASTWGNTTRFWDVNSEEQLFAFAGYIDRFSNDGTKVGFRSAKTGVCQFESRRLRKTISPADPKFSASQPLDLDVHPNNRWVAMGENKGVRICDLQSGTRLVDIPGRGKVRFHPDGKSLLIGNHEMTSWPILVERLENGNQKLVIGPPQTILPKNVVNGMDIDPSGNHFAVLTDGRTFVGSFDDPEKLVPMQDVPNEMGVSLSRGARLVAVGNHLGTNAHVFDGATGKLLHTVSTPGHARASLSPDGDLLAVTSDNTAEVYETTSWQKVYTLRDSPFEVAWPSSFSDDGKYLLFALRKPRSTLIVEAKSGQYLIRIPGAAGTTSRNARPVFTPDQQLVRIKEGNSVEAWDVASIRKELGTIELDWIEEVPGATVVVPSVSKDLRIPDVELRLDSPRSTVFENTLRDIQGRFNQKSADATFAGWQKDYPNDADLWQARGKINASRGELVALDDFTNVISLNHEFAEAFYSRAVAGRNLNQRENVVSDLASFLELEHDNIDWAMRATQLHAWEVAINIEQQKLSDSEYEKALAQAKSFETWVSKNGNRPEDKRMASRTLGLAFLRTGEIDSALTVLESIAPSTTKLFASECFGVEFMLAMCHAENENMQEARRHYQMELDSVSDFGSMLVTDAVDWQSLRLQTEQELEMERATKLVWSPIELAACASWDTGRLLVQFFPRSKRFSNLEKKELEPTDDPVVNLLWEPSRKRGELTFHLSVSEGGAFDGRLHLTHSWDYGLFEIRLNGKVVEARFDGQLDEVVFGDGVDFDSIGLRKGINELVIKNVGKSPHSLGVKAGIERLEFTRK